MNFFKKKCEACGEEKLGWSELSRAVRLGKVRCNSCKAELLASSGTRWYLSFIAALLVPLFILFFVMFGFVWGAILAFLFQYLIYRFALFNIHLKSKKQ